MPAPESLPARLIGALFVERGLVSESQIRVALEIQRETGQQLGQVLVERFGVSRKELASVVAEQWAKLGGSSGPEDSASWRRLGEIFVERGFVTEGELEQALARQRQTGERLGEALVAQGVISKFELAGALAEQMATLGDPAVENVPAEQPEATVHHLPTRASDPAEAPLAAAGDGVPATEPEVAAAGDEQVAADVGELVAEGAEAVEAAVDVVELAVTSLDADAIAIDDVGHVSLVGAAADHAESESPEAEPAALFDDLRGAITAEASLADGPEPESIASVGCLAFAPTTDGYRLVGLESLPEPGETIEVPDVGERLVLRVGRSPLPGDSRRCVYVEEPVTPVPVAVLAR